jgi:hypothetical protein
MDVQKLTAPNKCPSPIVADAGPWVLDRPIAANPTFQSKSMEGLLAPAGTRPGVVLAPKTCPSG